MITSVIKRDKTIVPYALKKITEAIFKAGKSTGEFGYRIAEHLAHGVDIRLEQLGSNELDIETIQDIVEETLISFNYRKTAKSYILYRSMRSRTRSFIDGVKPDLIRSYINQEDWKIKENSNMGFSLQGLNNYVFSEITAHFWLNEIYPQEISEAHKTGDIHLHDLSLLSTYCCGWDLEDFLLKGFTGVTCKTTSLPPKHFRTALGQLCNLIYTLQGEAAGAQAVSNFDTLLAPFVAEDNLSYDQVKQGIQEFIFNMNVSTRVGFQTPFSNITLDVVPPKSFKNKPIIIGGEYIENKTYGDYAKEMKMINRAFCEVMIEGDANGRLFSFPIPTYNVTTNFDWDDPDLDCIFHMTGKYGIPYFANYVNSDIDPEDVTSMCPLHGSTKVPVRAHLKNGQVRLISHYSIEDLYSMQDQYIYEVCNKSYWSRAKIHQYKTLKCVTITLDNGIEVTMDIRHEQPIKRYINVPSDPENFDEMIKDLTTGYSIFVRNAPTEIITVEDLKVGMFIPCDYPINSTFKDKLPLMTRINDLKENYYWLKVVHIEETKEQPEFVYCFVKEDEDDKLFQIENGIITHNCRLRIDRTKLDYRGGGLFGAAPKTGSTAVVTINLPRIGFEADTEEQFFSLLDHRIELSKQSHIIKRKILEDMTDKGLYPYSKFYLKEIKEHTGYYWANHFNTIGIIGMNECCLNFLGQDIGTTVGMEFANKVMDHIREKLVEIQLDTNLKFNLEATPAEGTTYTLGLKDKKLYGDKMVYANGPEIPYYTNSTHLPVNYTDDMFEVLDLQDELQTKYTGGTVVHLFLGEAINDVNVTKNLVRKICNNYRLPYFSLTPTFSTCCNHGYLQGEQHKCPHCEQPTEIYSRVVGFYRPVQTWNVAKEDEFKIRKTFK